MPTLQEKLFKELEVRSDALLCDSPMAGGFTSTYQENPFQRLANEHGTSMFNRSCLESQGALAIMGDALGVLHDARRFRAKDKVLNLIMAELALIIAPMGQELRTAHLWTQRNSTCDLLSRLAEGKGVPVVGASRLDRCARESSQDA